MSTQHIAFYGKGGVGTTTTATNVSVALAEAGHRVVLVGFGPGHGSTEVLRGDRPIRTILDVVQYGGDALGENAIVRGFKGVFCMETGLPAPNAACTAQDPVAVIEFLKKRPYREKHKPDFVIYDVSGEAFCSAAAGALINDIAERIFVVSSADFTSFSAVNAFFSIMDQRRENGAKLGGIIANGLTTPFAETIIGDFAAKSGTRIVGTIPRSLVVMQSALYSQSVIEAAPLSNNAYGYRRLARRIIENGEAFRPRPLSSEALKTWAREWGDMILELETGIIGGGGGI